jgi:hypothetical protein
MKNKDGEGNAKESLIITFDCEILLTGNDRR